jgi:hypothetical protein
VTAPIPITPETRVAELLQAYPDLEQVLISAAPAFSKLKNPVLRRTIARVTSLRRAAEIAGISTRDLVGRLRRAAGLPEEPPLEADDGADLAPEDGPAAWVDAGRVRWTVDADALLADGAEPISEVLQRAAQLDRGDLGLIRSSFRPAPLIELLEGRGFRVAVVRSGDHHATFIGRADDGGPGAS